MQVIGKGEKKIVFHFHLPDEMGTCPLHAEDTEGLGPL